MTELIQWAASGIILTGLAAIIIWDHKTTKREEKKRTEKEGKAQSGAITPYTPILPFEDTP